MSKASQIVILCEDRMHEVFVRRFLKRWGVANLNRLVRTTPYPEGRQSGEQHVRTRYPNELKALRSRHASTILIVVMDADAQTAQDRRRELDRSADNEGLGPRGDTEPVVFVIPKWSIENWLAWLDGNAVDEGDKERNRAAKTRYSYRHESDAHPLIDRLAEDCKANRTLPNPPGSLADACHEFERIRNVLSGS